MRVVIRDIYCGLRLIVVFIGIFYFGSLFFH